MSPREFADRLDAMADELPLAVAEALRDTTQDAVTRARWWSSGTLSRADLRRMDHPYAKRHGSPRLNPDFISGGRVFAGAWREGDPEEDGDGNFSAFVDNTDPVGPYLEQLDGGPNSTMFARRPNEQVAAEVQPRFEQRVAQAISRVLEG